MNLCLRSRIRSSLFNTFHRYSTSITESASDTVEPVIIEDEELVNSREEELEKKRNVSRLSPAHFNIINDRRPYEVAKCLAHKTVKYHRKMYGKYGSASGVNPSICWPSMDDIAEKKEYESVAYPYTISQMIQMAAEKRKQEKEKIEKREMEIATKYAKLEQWKKDLNDKIEKKAAAALAAKEKKERLVEEVRRHFGFKLDPRDERFQEMLAKREKEQKKLEKMAKRDEKEKAMIARLQQKNTEIN